MKTRVIGAVLLLSGIAIECKALPNLAKAYQEASAVVQQEKKAQEKKPKILLAKLIVTKVSDIDVRQLALLMNDYIDYRYEFGRTIPRDLIYGPQWVLLTYAVRQEMDRNMRQMEGMK